jgi:hypothetical protein
LRELHICRHEPGISHLLFADDSLLFFEGSVDQANIIKSILDRYEQGTGQLVSLGKCSIMYGESCSDEVQTEIKQILKYETTLLRREIPWFAGAGREVDEREVQVYQRKIY